MIDKVFEILFKLTLFLKIPLLILADTDNNTTNPKTFNSPKIIRVVSPGVFDSTYGEYQMRLRLWGVSFPRRGEPGYQESIVFAEKTLINRDIRMAVKIPFDTNNLKVVDITVQDIGKNYSSLAIENGIGWHNEKETGRLGLFLIAQMKAKRNKAGIWSLNYNFQGSSVTPSKPQPQLPNILSASRGNLPLITYWVTSLGKVHRPSCAFYQRGRGKLTSNPTGSDCRICGGRGGNKK